MRPAASILGCRLLPRAVRRGRTDIRRTRDRAGNIERDHEHEKIRGRVDALVGKTVDHRGQALIEDGGRDQRRAPAARGDGRRAGGGRDSGSCPRPPRPRRTPAPAGAAGVTRRPPPRESGSTSRPRHRAAPDMFVGLRPAASFPGREESGACPGRGPLRLRQEPEGHLPRLIHGLHNMVAWQVPQGVEFAQGPGDGTGKTHRGRAREHGRVGPLRARSNRWRDPRPPRPRRGFRGSASAAC